MNLLHSNRTDDNHGSQADVDTIDLGYWILAIYRERRFIVLFTMIVALIGVIYSFAVTPTFTSQAKLILPTGGASSQLSNLIGQFGALAGITGGGGGGGADNADFFRGIFLSRHMIDTLIDSFNLFAVYGVPKDAKGRLALHTILKDRGISVSFEKGGFISLSVETLSPELARDMAYEVILAANETINRLNMVKARDKRIFLESRISAVYEEIYNLENQIRDFCRKNHVVEFNEQSKFSINALMTLMQRIEDLRLRREVQAGVIGRDHPEIKQIEREIEEMIQRCGYAFSRGTMESNFGPGEKVYVPVEDATLNLFLPVAEIPELSFKYLEFNREMTLQTTILTLLRQQVEMAKIEEKKEDLHLRILDPPSLPVYKTSPVRKLILAYSVFLGFLAAIVIVIVWNISFNMRINNNVI